MENQHQTLLQRDLSTEKQHQALEISKPSLAACISNFPPNEQLCLGRDFCGIFYLWQTCVDLLSQDLNIHQKLPGRIQLDRIQVEPVAHQKQNQWQPRCAPAGKQHLHLSCFFPSLVFCPQLSSPKGPSRCAITSWNQGQHLPSHRNIQGRENTVLAQGLSGFSW